MTDEELVALAKASLARATAHEGLSVCTNPAHTHIASPCEDDCLDHLHQCSLGCGEYPCAVVREAIEVSTCLMELAALTAAHAAGLQDLRVLTAQLTTELEKTPHE